MSWFDAGALANIAKTALKEAQKTIDKALDIKEDGAPLNLSETMQEGSIWGSFSGSFFVAKDEPQSPSIESLIDSGNEKDFSASKLVVVEEDSSNLNNSESVEVCTTPESLSRQTSNSVEILADSQLTDEFVSPIVEDSGSLLEQMSPESVEIIPEESSIADDTLSSISEATVVPDSVLFNKNCESGEAAIITRAPGRSLHLPLIDQQQKTNIIDIPQLLDGSFATDEGSISDKTLVESRAVEGSTGSDTASTTTDVSTTNSTYLKKMLADAMAEKSSSEKSDLVKIGSDTTSCDELETTTSSDIEIISSPNGSTQSRQSPIKKPKNNVSVEAFAPDSDIDGLSRRIAEMTEILEARETKLIETNGRNAELQEENNALRNQLDCVLTQQLDLSQVTDEYTQRLSALEKKFQQALREKDVLKKQLEQAKFDAGTCTSKNEQDKEEIIRQLRQEGEKLSKQQLQHGNIIKKLRAKEKEHETTIKTLKETNATLSTENDRLKKSLSAKEEVERTQIEAVHNLTQKHKKLEVDFIATKNQLEDLTQKHLATRKSLETCKQELQQQTKTTIELQLNQNHLETLQQEKTLLETENREILGQLEVLRDRLTETDSSTAQTAQKLKRENADLLRRLEQAENRNEALAQTGLEVSKPLIRQLEALQTTHNVKMAGYEKMEAELTQRIGDLLSKSQMALGNERAAKEESVRLRSRVAELEGMRHRSEMDRMRLERLETEKLMAERDLNGKIEALRSELRQQAAQIVEKEEEIQNLRQQLAVEKLSFEKQQQESPPTVDRSPASSPTLSLGKASIPDSLSGSFWSQDEPFEATHLPRYTNMFEMQILQSTLKQREGELQQLQWELSRREQERALLNSEISALIGRIEALEAAEKDNEALKGELAELQKQYDTLCQLFGEKVEETEELRLDLVDVKDMYKSQIDELLRQQKGAQMLL